MKASERMFVTEAIEQLSKSQRGRNAMQHMLEWMDEHGLGLDGDNQHALEVLLAMFFKLPGSTRDMMREAVEAV